jgi:hypothetical protein
MTCLTLEDTAMREPFTARLARGSLKCANFRQSVLRFGLPVVLLFRATDYIIFWMTLGRFRLQYPWLFEIPADVALLFFVSVPWWWLMREIAAWKSKNHQG